MLRAMLGVYLRGKIWKEVIQQRTKVVGTAQRIGKLKWRWTSHVFRRTDNRRCLFYRWHVFRWRSRHIEPYIGNRTDGAPSLHQGGWRRSGSRYRRGLCPADCNKLMIRVILLFQNFIASYLHVSLVSIFMCHN